MRVGIKLMLLRTDHAANRLLCSAVLFRDGFMQVNLRD